MNEGAACIGCERVRHVDLTPRLLFTVRIEAKKKKTKQKKTDRTTASNSIAGHLYTFTLACSHSRARKKKGQKNVAPKGRPHATPREHPLSTLPRRFIFYATLRRNPSITGRVRRGLRTLCRICRRFRVFVTVAYLYDELHRSLFGCHCEPLLFAVLLRQSSF